jgi:thiosulfate/3-mercaptopyruvate sulfurtransferase
MSQNLSTPPQRFLFGPLAALLLCVATALPGIAGSASPAATGADSLPTSPTPADTITADRLVQPEALARLLADSTARQPVVLQVGFKVLFRSGHIPRSRYAGPGSKPEGLAALKQALIGIPRQQAVVLYCGCCPWTDCPNVHPAFQAARAMGFRNVRVLFVAKNLQHDWVDKGFPIREGDK